MVDLTRPLSYFDGRERDPRHRRDVADFFTRLDQTRDPRYDDQVHRRAEIATETAYRLADLAYDQEVYAAQGRGHGVQVADPVYDEFLRAANRRWNQLSGAYASTQEAALQYYRQLVLAEERLITDPQEGNLPTVPSDVLWME